jgi:predicted ester cyclase
MGIPPTHKQVTITGLTLEHLADGQIVDEWNSWDHVGLLPPLGTLPAPGQAAR